MLIGNVVTSSRNASNILHSLKGDDKLQGNWSTFAL